MVDVIVEAGLIIQCFGEPQVVSMEPAAAEPALEDTLVALLFLHIRAIKSAASPVSRRYTARSKPDDCKQKCYPRGGC